MSDWTAQNTLRYEFSTKDNYFRAYRGPAHEVSLIFIEDYPNSPSGRHGHNNRVSVRSMPEAFYQALEPCPACLPETIERSRGLREAHAENLKLACRGLYSWVNEITHNSGMLGGPPIGVEESRKIFDEAVQKLEQSSYIPRDLEVRADELQKAIESGDGKLQTIIEQELLGILTQMRSSRI